MWRQADATRNAVAQAAHSIVGTKRTKGMDTKTMNEALFAKGVNFNDYPIRIKRGAMVFTTTYSHTGVDPRTGERKSCTRRRWSIDENMPILSRDENYLHMLMRTLRDKKL
jgi:tRNA(His) 5'-end guanylyltransferase